MQPGLRLSALAIALAILAASSGCAAFGQQPQQAGPAGAVAGRQQSTVVSVTQAKQGAIAAVLTYSANIQARSQVSLAPRTSGRIEKIRVDVGSVVKAGDILAEIEHGTLDAQLKQAEANLASAEARLAGIKSGGRPEDVGVAEATLASAQARLEQVKRGATEADLQAAQASLASAQVALNRAQSDYSKLKNPSQDELTSAKAQVEKAEAALQKAQAEYDKVAWRADIAMRPEAVALQQATIDYQAALANYNIKMNPRPEDVRTVEQNLISAQAAYDTAKARLAQLQNGPTEQDLVIAQASVQSAQNTLALRKNPYTDSDLKAAQATVAQAQASLEAARQQRVEAAIVAPFDGIVSQRLLAEGAVASANTPVVALVSNEVELWLSIEEARLGQLRPGLTVQLAVPAYPGQAIAAKVETVAPTADTKSHTFAVRVVPDKQDGKLKPGMFAEVKVTTEKKDSAILVPREALVQRNNKLVLFAVVDGVARMRDVTLGLADDANQEIVSGVAVGDQIVVAGLSSLTDGNSVRLAGQQDQRAAPGAPGGQTKPSGTPGAAGTAGPARDKPGATATAESK